MGPHPIRLVPLREQETRTRACEEKEPREDAGRGRPSRAKGRGLRRNQPCGRLPPAPGRRPAGGDSLPARPPAQTLVLPCGGSGGSGGGGAARTDQAVVQPQQLDPPIAWFLLCIYDNSLGRRGGGDAWIGNQVSCVLTHSSLLADEDLLLASVAPVKLEIRPGLDSLCRCNQTSASIDILYNGLA